MIIENQDDLYDDLTDTSQDDNLDEGKYAGFDLEDNDDADMDDADDDDDYTMDDTKLITDYDTDADEDTEDDEDDSDGEHINESDLINDLLLAKGIKDSTIQYENDAGEIEEVDFYSLPKEEQLAILNSSDKDINYGLADAEIEAVNFLRENGVTLEESIEYFKRQAIQEYIDGQNIAGIEVDQYSDEELFALDLKVKYDDLTDEEIEIELTKQLEHPELFKKKADRLRTEYQEIEQQQLEQARSETQMEEQEKFQELQDNLVSVAESIEDIGGLDLDTNDKNQILSYILEKDINGVSPFIKSLDSPKQLFELAWYATKGKEAFDTVHDYYKKEIDRVGKTAYERGKAEATKITPTNRPRKTFTRNQTQSKDSQSNYKHIDDLTID